MSEWQKTAAAELKAYGERIAQQEAQAATGRWGNERSQTASLKFRAENFEAEVTEVETDAWVVVAQGNKAKSLRLQCDPCVTGSELQLLTDRGWVCLSYWRQPDKFLTRLAAAIALLYSVPGVEVVP